MPQLFSQRRYAGTKWGCARTAAFDLRSTVEFAKRVCNNITLRREELQDLEENSIGVSNQVRCSSTNAQVIHTN